MHEKVRACAIYAPDKKNIWKNVYYKNAFLILLQIFYILINQSVTRKKKIEYVSFIYFLSSIGSKLKSSFQRNAFDTVLGTCKPQSRRPCRRFIYLLTIVIFVVIDTRETLNENNTSVYLQVINTNASLIIYGSMIYISFYFLTTFSNRYRNHLLIKREPVGMCYCPQSVIKLQFKKLENKIKTRKCRLIYFKNVIS